MFSTKANCACNSSNKSKISILGNNPYQCIIFLKILGSPLFSLCLFSLDVKEKKIGPYIFLT